MISTRLHGVIDYGVAALFGRLAMSKGLPPQVRATFGATGAYHAAYALLTDYAAGLRPTFSMRQHLLLDVLGAAALISAGVQLRRLPRGSCWSPRAWPRARWSPAAALRRAAVRGRSWAWRDAC